MKPLTLLQMLSYQTPSLNDPITCSNLSKGVLPPTMKHSFMTFLHNQQCAIVLPYSRTGCLVFSGISAFPNLPLHLQSPCSSLIKSNCRCQLSNCSSITSVCCIIVIQYTLGLLISKLLIALGSPLNFRNSMNFITQAVIRRSLLKTLNQ